MSVLLVTFALSQTNDKISIFNGRSIVTEQTYTMPKPFNYVVDTKEYLFINSNIFMS